MGSQANPRSNNLKILLVSSLYEPHVIGGAERVAQTLAEGLIHRGHQVEVLTATPDGEERRESVNGVPVDYVRVRNIYRPFSDSGTQTAARKMLFHAIDSYNPIMASLVRRKVRAYRPDVVNSHNITGFSPAIFPAIRAEQVPLAHTLHDQYLLCPRTTMYRNDNCSQQCLGCTPYAIVRTRQAQVDLAVGVSEFIIRRHQFLGAFQHTATCVIRNSAPTRPPDTTKRAPGPLRFGYLGQIRATKGLHVLVEAFLAAQVANAELHIAGRGDPSYEASVRSAAASNPHVRWSGFVDSTKFLNTIDVLIVPSLWNDTAPLVVLEAFAASRPVIGSNRGGIPEFITPKTGWIFDPAEPQQLAALLRQCAKSPGALEHMGEQARLVAEQQNLDRFLDQYQDAFAALLKRTA